MVVMRMVMATAVAVMAVVVMFMAVVMGNHRPIRQRMGVGVAMNWLAAYRVGAGLGAAAILTHNVMKFPVMPVPVRRRAADRC